LAIFNSLLQKSKMSLHTNIATVVMDEKPEFVSNGGGSIRKTTKRPLKKRKRNSSPARHRSLKKRQKVQTEKRKANSLKRAKEIIFDLIPKQIETIDYISTQINDHLKLEDVHDHMKPCAKILKSQELLKENLVCLLKLLDELEVFIVLHTPMYQETGTHGEDVQSIVRRYISGIRISVMRYIFSFPDNSIIRGETVALIRRRPHIPDLVEYLKLYDENSIRTLALVSKRILLLHCLLHDVLKKNWNKVVDPEGYRRQYDSIIC